MTNGNDSVNFVPDTLNELGSVVSYGTQGLTKREYFAAMILQGLFAGITTHGANEKIEAAVTNADYLIKELNKGVK